MAPRWTIESQRVTKVLTGAGTFRDVWEIRFATAHGTHGIIDVPVNLYSPEYVKEQIDEYVDRIQAVETLQG